ncbi:DUF4832 domain-containing protein [Sphingomonas sp. LR60]|uniref:DUF4832 domain-containing protein n=1 Tax=Sphingomonas sp. LR60 TaxID=3050233 RepID=UPI003FA79C52
MPGQTTNVELTTRLPHDLAAGRYAVALALPDAAPTLRHDPRYAIRFANADRAGSEQGWDARMGLFRLGANLTIGAPQQD